MAFYINSFYSKEEVKDEMKRIKEQKIKQELLKSVIDHLKNFKCYPIEFEYNNKIYDYDFIIKTIQERKNKNEHTARNTSRI